ncbi:hemolysin family protein [Mycobacterium sp. CVI_P3]|uniref:Hemolysin family protein n=1 Tax=Mycobacterium pinniadriaticum TaxID=2994102 RepID=A0ABT3SAE6_9MYCO|nr:hemolysin family protein [Mycobacterium pinniadriaticum]MCX2929664.1 hemolysin family protein [Mycobacterium pinniadriaticum]MCX2936088.1 hemolysin family protein [Mycobacterium pinniadriaticum]
MNVLYTSLSLLAIVILTLGTALFVAAEFSLTALERSTVDANARDGDRRDHFVQRAHRTLSFQLSGAQLGISITTLATGYLAEPVLARLFDPVLDLLRVPDNAVPGIALALAILIATSLSMVFGELVPKNLAVARPVPTARATAGFQLAFATVMTPAIKLTNGTANWILRRLGIEPAEELRSARSPEELGALVRNSAEHGSLDETTAALVNRSLQFGSRIAEEFMTPRTEIEALDADDTVTDLVTASADTGFSRFPIVNGDLDETIGIVHVKQVFSLPSAQRSTTKLVSLAIPVPTVPSTLDGDALMAQLRAHGLQTAMVVDEYGGTAGMVTVEDLIEEIVGDVRDEHDDSTPDFQKSGQGWRVSGLLRIDEVAEATGFRASEGEYETIGGLVLETLGHIPEPGESVELSAFDPDGPFDDPVRWRATVIEMDGRRIDQLVLTEVGRSGDGDGER